MKLNLIEKALVNNRARALLQRRYEAPLLRRLGGCTQGLRVLEIGCGRGVGTEIIFKDFGAREVHAFDLDPDMIFQAKARLAEYAPEQLKLFVGDAAEIDAESQTYDAVFDFGIIHHVPQWRQVVSEVARVLLPDGRFFFEEVTSHALNRWLYRTFLDHPKTDRFSGKQFIFELERQGIYVGRNYVERFFGDFVFGVGYG